MRTKLAPYVRSALLTEIAREKITIQDQFLTLDAISGNLRILLEVSVPDEPFYEAFDDIMDSGGIDVIDDPVTDPFYCLNRTRCQQIFSSEAADANSLTYKYASVGRGFLQRAAAALGDAPANESAPQKEGVPASDRIVRLDDNSVARGEMLGRLDELTAAVRGHNDEGGKLANDRERIVAELKAGQELLKAPSARVRVVWAVLGSALAFIAAEFAGGIIGDLASALLEALKPLLGL